MVWLNEPKSENEFYTQVHYSAKGDTETNLSCFCLVVENYFASTNCSGQRESTGLWVMCTNIVGYIDALAKKKKMEIEQKGFQDRPLWDAMSWPCPKVSIYDIVLQMQHRRKELHYAKINH